MDWAKAVLSIEHVMPQTLNRAWRSDLKRSLTDGQTIDEVHAAALHTLGNLTLTGYNGPLGNRPFSEKRKVLRDSGLAMNHAIAEHEKWGPGEIIARANELAERAVSLWPGPQERPKEPSAEGPKWRLLRQALASLPAGTWTAYSDVAELIGSHQVPVGAYLSNNLVRNAWRVLRADGSVSASFRWVEKGRQDNPVEVLMAEGVRFADGVADQSQRMWAVELADLVNLDTGEESMPTTSDEGLATLFWEALAEGDASEQTVAARKLVDVWREVGGELRIGQDDKIAAYLCWDKGRAVAPWVIYPEDGYVEVAFHLLKGWAPFDDQALREEFRQVCNQIGGVDIPPIKIDFRPWFGLHVLDEPEGVRAAVGALQWFVDAAGAASKEEL